jgi:hypothetical protein
VVIIAAGGAHAGLLQKNRAPPSEVRRTGVWCPHVVQAPLMTELRLPSRQVQTVFDLLGDKEDDITYSLGWALAQSDDLIGALLGEFFDTEPGEPSVILLQNSVTGAGRTDIELQTEVVHLILEAKRGWDLPRPGQLEQYATRFEKDKALTQAIAVVAESSAEWARPRIPQSVDGVPVHYISWSRVAGLVDRTARQARSTAEKRLLRELLRYMKGLMTMQNVTSNMVFVVALGVEKLVDNGPSFADIVVDHNRYFHPLAGGWPKEPPNYLGFRFWGEVQQIRHVEDYELHEAPWETIPGLAGQLPWEPSPHMFYKLGPPISPPHPVKTGGLYGPGHHWAALDLLLTSSTLRDARDRTQERLAAAGET